MRIFYREKDNYPQYFYSDKIKDLLYGPQKTVPPQTRIALEKEKPLTNSIFIFLLIGLVLLCLFVIYSIHTIKPIINGDGDTFLCIFIFVFLIIFSIIDVVLMIKH